MNVSCPGCNAPYFVDERKIPAKGGRLTCASCGTRWEIYRSHSGEIRRAKEPAPPVKQTDSGPAPIRLPRPAVPTGSPVTCPRCGHSFVPEEAVPPAPAPSEPAGRKVILLVEDQKYFTEVATEALGPSYRTISVGTKDEALRVISAEPPSLMILDLSLARGQDGRDLLRAIPAKKFPILIFTARDETELYGEAWEELKSLGADDIVHKGMNIGEELRRKVTALLRSH